MSLTWCEIKLKNLILFLISLFFPLIFLIIGLTFFSDLGTLIVAFSGIIITLLMVLFSDKILLSFFKIRKSNVPEWANSFIKSVSFKFGIKNFVVLTTEGRNLYTIDSFVGVPRIIIGEYFFDFFSKEECEALIFASFLRIKNKESKFRTYSSILINLFFLPFLKIPLQGLKISFLSFRYLIRSYFYKNEIELKSFDKSLGIYRIPFASALFKLNIENTGEGFFIEDCDFSENKSGDIIQHFFDTGYDFNIRYKDLLREDEKA